MKVTSSVLSALTAICATLAFTAPAAATVINFDDIAVPSQTYVAVGSYAGFNWSNVYAENSLPTNGYSTGIVSPTNAGFNGSGTVASFSSATGTFDFNSGYFTSAFNSEEVVVSDDLGDSKTFLVSGTTPTLVSFGWTGVSTVSIDAVSDGQFTQVVFDDLTVNASAAVPEPASWALMLLGCVGLGLKARQRR